MAFSNLLTMVAMTTVLLLNLTTKADACLCASLSVCQRFEAAEVVLKGTALERSESAGEFGKITYTFDAKKIYKPSAKHDGNNEISFDTNASSAACGVHLELGKQYLLGLYQSEDGPLTASSCGLVRVWNAVTKEERAILKVGCEDEDPCDGSCSEFQECLFHSDFLGDEFYCADVCSPSPCEEGEECTLEQLVQCVRAPCPKSAVCNGSEP